MFFVCACCLTTFDMACDFRQSTMGKSLRSVNPSLLIPFVYSPLACICCFDRLHYCFYSIDGNICRSHDCQSRIVYLTAIFATINPLKIWRIDCMCAITDVTANWTVKWYSLSWSHERPADSKQGEIAPSISGSGNGERNISGKF